MRASSSVSTLTDTDDVDDDDDAVVTSSPLVSSNRSSCLSRRSTGDKPTVDRSAASPVDADDAIAISHAQYSQFTRSRCQHELLLAGHIFLFSLQIWNDKNSSLHLVKIT